MEYTMYVNEIGTNYSEVPTATLDTEMYPTFEEFVRKNQLEIVSRTSSEAVVRAEWGNGEGYDEFRVDFVYKN